MTREELKFQYLQETNTLWCGSTDGKPSKEFVDWLMDKLIAASQPTETKIPDPVSGVSGEKTIRHNLEYSIWSCKVSWCPICNQHFYNERNKEHTTKATPEHYHELPIK